MALLACHECKAQVSSEAKTCPQCGATPKTASNRMNTVVGLVVMGGAVWFFLGGGLEKQAAKDMANIEQQVAADAVKQYQITKRNGTAIDICVHAGMVSAAFVQAKDEPNYQVWKKTEQQDCAAAGMPKN